EETGFVISEEGNVTQFKNHHKALPVPFVIYADGESILRKIKEEQEKNTMIYQNHQVNNLGCKFVSQYPEVLNDEYKEFHGEHAIILSNVPLQSQIATQTDRPKYIPKYA
ncbi:MAG: hypothetical protein ACKPKO_47945, partial [Candidatus Fonsibacter sp.]